MADDTMPLLDVLLQRGGGDFREIHAEEVLGRLFAFDVEGQTGRRASSGARRARPSATAIASAPLTRGWARWG